MYAYCEQFEGMFSSLVAYCCNSVCALLHFLLCMPVAFLGETFLGERFNKA